MPVVRGHIPELPNAPRPQPFTLSLHRSYPGGHQQFSRALVGHEMELTITAPEDVAAGLSIKLMTTMNDGGEHYVEYPFSRTDPGTFVCRITPERPGLFSFRAHFSTDGGGTTFGDSVADAWVLVDPPQVDDVRLYSMVPTVSGTIRDWTNDLPRIAAMGFNTLHLLPITCLDDSESPYAAFDLFHIDDAYVDESSVGDTTALPGGAAASVDSDSLWQLEDFIEKAKSLGIRLCFDLVLNHVGVTSRMARQAPDWIVPDSNRPDGMMRARFWNGTSWQSWEDIVLINYEHPSTEVRERIWDYMTQYALFWAKFADYTNGFVRFDNLHSSDGAYQYSLTKSLRQTFPNLGIIAEYFTDDDTLLNSVPAWGLNLVLATPWNYRFVPQLREYLRYIHRISEHVRYFMPITSHDSGTPAQEFGSVESTVPRYVAAALLGTGATGITQGVEWGSPTKLEFIGRQPRIEVPPDPVFALLIGKVNQILAEHPTFRRGGNCTFIDGDHHAVIAAFRRDHKATGGGYMVVCNFDTYGEQHFEADLGELLGTTGPVTATDLISGEELHFDSPRGGCTLAPCSAMVMAF